ncbi:MAG: DMT family transporter [Pseudomonadota bacterium]
MAPVNLGHVRTLALCIVIVPRDFSVVMPAAVGKGAGMRLFLLTSLVMVAFAANSVLNRAALLAPEIDPLAFAWIRTVSGAAALLILVAARDRSLAIWGPLRLPGALSLALYMTTFSLAYVAIESGLGALILFGGVQITMFAGALVAKEAIPVGRWIGAVMAFLGLIWLFWPSEAFELSMLHAGLMLAAALGWGIYSLVGRKAGEPLRASASNFLLAAPLCVGLAMLAPVQLDGAPTTPYGIGLALVSGVVTSAMAYALWYSVLPQLKVSVAGLAMVSPPVIAVLGGAVLLGEVITLKLLVASALVLGGVAIGVLAPQRTSGSSGS